MNHEERIAPKLINHSVTTRTLGTESPETRLNGTQCGLMMNQTLIRTDLTDAVTLCMVCYSTS
jgi:hypothetical protein